MTPAELAVAAELARNDFYFYNRFMMQQRRNLVWRRARHHPVMAAALMRVYRGECKRLILNLPPRYTKTEMAVKGFISWCMGKHPDSEFIHVSYSAPLAVGNSWETREMVNHPAYKLVFPETRLAAGSTASEHWRTTKGGVMYATGSEGSITGYGAGKMRPGFGGAIVIDDPHKADEALSETRRKAVISNFSTTLESRKNDPLNTPIIVIMQRLHEEDLAGWLEAGGNGEKWEVVRIPVLDDNDEPIWPEKHTREVLQAMERANPYVFAGQYRQMPAPPAGGNFQPGKIEIVSAIPAGITSRVRGWDLAASKNSGAYTAGVKLGRIASTGQTIILDVVREQGGPHDVRRLIRGTASQDEPGTLQSLPQDPGQAGKVQVTDLGTVLTGFVCKFSPESGDKIARADPFASQVNIGNVLMLKAPWNDAYVRELGLFPNGKFKDQVDASSRAFSEMDNSMERFLALAGG